MSTNTPFADIKDNLEFLDDWEDRYRYLIELGQALAPISEDERTDRNKINGCVSQVWLSSKQNNEDTQIRLFFTGDSDAMIVKGLVAVLIAFYSGKTVESIAQSNAVEMFDQLGLREHLTAQRANGLVAMVERIRGEAQALV